MEIRWFHGLAAYNRPAKGHKYCPIETRRRAGVVASGAEIAAADKPIGAFGLVVEGKTLVVFERDCWSRVCKGQRVTARYDLWQWTPDGTDADEAMAHQWCADQTNAYCEAFVSHCTILAVWCKRDASNERYWQARSLALKLRVPLVEIDRGTSIGAWCGTLNPVEEEFV